MADGDQRDDVAATTKDLVDVWSAQARDGHGCEAALGAGQQHRLQEAAGFEHDEVARLVTAGVLIVELGVGAAEVRREHEQ